MRKKKMFCIGSYGCGNRGDDAILQGICYSFPEWRIYATNGGDTDLKSWLPIKTVRCRLNEGFSISVLFSMLCHLPQMLYHIATADALLFGGGSLIHDLTPYNLPYMFFWEVWAKLCRTKVYFYSMGIGPINTNIGKRLCKHYLKRADAVFVRDERGAEYCREFKLTNWLKTADSAFAITAKNQCNGATLEAMQVKEQMYFCVTGSQWFRSANFWKRNQMDFTRQIENFANCIREVAISEKIPVVFVSTVSHDFELAENLKAQCVDIDFRVTPPDWNSKQIAEIIENGKFLIAVRMHSMIFAARQSIPFISMVYDEKVDELLQYLDVADCSIDLDNVTPKALLEKLAFMYAKEDMLKKQYYDKKEEFRKKLQDSIRVINDLETMNL